MIKVKALDCLVSMLKCMVEWSRELYTDPHINGQMSHMGKEYRYALTKIYMLVSFSDFLGIRVEYKMEMETVI